MASRVKKRQLRVFLCHSSPDKKRIRVICQLLKSAGVHPWLDEEKVHGGEEWEETIGRELARTDAVVVCLSRKSITRAGFMHREIRRAVETAESQPEGRIFLIPLKLEPCKLPERLKRLHCINFFDQDGYSRLVWALMKRAASLGSRIAEIEPPDDAIKHFLEYGTAELPLDGNAERVARIFRLTYNKNIAASLSEAESYMADHPDDHSFAYSYVYDLYENHSAYDAVITFSESRLASWRSTDKIWASRVLKYRGMAQLARACKAGRDPLAIAEAHSTLLESVTLNPKLSESHFHLAFTYAVQRDLRSADVHLGLAIDTTSDTQMKLGMQRMRHQLRHEPAEFMATISRSRE